MLHDLYEKYPKDFPLPLLLDGATGTRLMKMGMPNGCCTENFVLENPDIFIKIQKEYTENGSDAVYAPTFGANRPSLSRHGYNGDVGEINKRLVDISKRTNAKLIGGDMSPTGLFIEPLGDSTFDEIVEIYAEQAGTLDEAGVDFFICETNINLNEVRAEVIGIRSVSDKPIFVTVTVDENGRTISGDLLISAFLTLSELGINAFGANCSTGPDKMLDQLIKLVPYSADLGIPLIAKPNAGMPHQHDDGSQTFDMDPIVFEEYAEKFLESGIYILGGCCGTDEEFIRRMRLKIDSFNDFKELERTDTSELVCSNREFCARSEAESIIIKDMDEAREFIDDMIYLDSPVTVEADEEILKFIKKYYNGKL